jgi:hypothetical protein
MIVECIPVPKEEGDLAPMYFKVGEIPIALGSYYYLTGGHKNGGKVPRRRKRPSLAI